MKEGVLCAAAVPVTAADLEQINKLSRKTLTAEEVYTFSLVLCDNEIDRDQEQFAVSALQELAGLFVGKTGIFDHSMSGKDQKARIYATAMETVEGRSNRVGQPFCRLSAKAYMLCTDENAGLIAEIDGGIKKEVSVGVSMGRSLCSVCGKSVQKGGCAHQPGQQYGSHVCYRILEEARDAYEWSFVAVPAQPGAGVIKAFRPKKREETEMNDTFALLKSAQDALTLTKAQREELLERVNCLEEEAELGRAYHKSLLDEVLGLLPLAMPEMDAVLFGQAAGVMTTAELKGFHKAFTAKKAALLPAAPQLAVQKQTELKKCLEEFKI